MAENFYQLVNRVKLLEKKIKDFNAEESVERFCESEYYSDKISLDKLQKRFFSWYANEICITDEIADMRVKNRLLDNRKKAS